MSNQHNSNNRSRLTEKLIAALVITIMLFASHSITEQVSDMANNLTGLIVADISLGDWMVISFKLTLGGK